MRAEATSASSAICGTGPLEILLTNDDGYQAPGIRALYDELRKAGHHVRLVAPSTNASGSSSSFTWSAVTIVRDPSDPNVIGVTATPATAVVLGATAFYPADRRPDLIVSGINDGDNTGSLLALSGTIGASLAGTMLLDPPIPGIAVNAARAGTAHARAALPLDQGQQMARHLTYLVAGLRGWFCDGGHLTRGTAALNVNYPARPVSAVRGVRAARQGRTTDLHLVFESSGPDAYASRTVTPPPTADYADSDVTLLAEGYVTVTPISAVLGAQDASLADLAKRIDAVAARAP